MASIVHSEDLALWRQHQANVVASLNHRLAIARAKQDHTLIQLLEQEQKQLAGDCDRPSSWQDQFSTLWDDFTAWVRGDYTVQVWQTVDQYGDRWWCAYNPKTGQSIYSDSEGEMRQWIEQNYVADPH